MQLFHQALLKVSYLVIKKGPSLEHPNLVLVSYGSPYVVYDMPHMPCVLNAYSPDHNMQSAALRVLTGDLEATGTSPVNLEAPYQLKSQEGLRYAR